MPQEALLPPTNSMATVDTNNLFLVSRVASLPDTESISGNTNNNHGVGASSVAATIALSVAAACRVMGSGQEAGNTNNNYGMGASSATAAVDVSVAAATASEPPPTKRKQPKKPKGRLSKRKKSTSDYAQLWQHYNLTANANFQQIMSATLPP
mmetsp:Transcript_21156/g.36374  ORF Transcript_21156/g.36374 Transcript_21156/m.36374 type:complete len:153 (+) Transcript_21156:298-756(+)